MKTVNKFTQILRMSNKTLWTVFVKKLDQYHDVDKKLLPNSNPFLLEDGLESRWAVVSISHVPSFVNNP